ncbi:hypothetical protein Tco_0380907 [Tanacetum coccineum]
MEAQDRWKSYANKRRRPIEFNVGDFVMLKVSPWKGVMRFKNKGKLSTRFMGPFKILKRVGEVAYTLEPPEEMRDDLEINSELTFQEEPVAILGRKLRQLRNKEIMLVKVEWKNRKGPSGVEKDFAEVLYLGSNTTYLINEYGVFDFQTRYGAFDMVYRNLSLVRRIQLMNTTYSSSGLIRILMSKRVPKAFWSDLQKFDVNLQSWSQMIETGIPCLVTTSFKYSLVNLSMVSFYFIDEKCADLVAPTNQMVFGVQL